MIVNWIMMNPLINLRRRCAGPILQPISMPDGGPPRLAIKARYGPAEPGLDPVGTQSGHRFK